MTYSGLIVLVLIFNLTFSKERLTESVIGPSGFTEKIKFCNHRCNGPGADLAMAEQQLTPEEQQVAE